MSGPPHYPRRDQNSSVTIYSAEKATNKLNLRQIITPIITQKFTINKTLRVFDGRLNSPTTLIDQAFFHWKTYKKNYICCGIADTRINCIKMTAQEAVTIMLKKDHFTKWLGLEMDKVEAGYCKLHFRIKKEMLNGFESVHGGVIFSASDSALAFAANSHGSLAVALEVSISFTKPAKEGDLLYVEANEIYLGNKTAVYDIRTTNTEGQLVAQFKGTVYRTGKEIK